MSWMNSNVSFQAKRNRREIKHGPIPCLLGVASIMGGAGLLVRIRFGGAHPHRSSHLAKMAAGSMESSAMGCRAASPYCSLVSRKSCQPVQLGSAATFGCLFSGPKRNPQRLWDAISPDTTELVAEVEARGGPPHKEVERFWTEIAGEYRLPSWKAAQMRYRRATSQNPRSRTRSGSD